MAPRRLQLCSCLPLNDFKNYKSFLYSIFPYMDRECTIQYYNTIIFYSLNIFTFCGTLDIWMTIIIDQKGVGTRPFE